MFKIRAKTVLKINCSLKTLEPELMEVVRSAYGLLPFLVYLKPVKGTLFEQSNPVYVITCIRSTP